MALRLLVITVARKPLSEGSVAKNVLKHGTGGLNIDDCRGKPCAAQPSGRWPANVILVHRGCLSGISACLPGCPVVDLEQTARAECVEFFEQMWSEDELTEYLTTLISPPNPHPRAFHIPDLATADWGGIATWAADSVTGIIARGTPTEAQSVELMRVLRPGAHLLLVAPDEQPTGHSGACCIEDAGFEIRDAILLAQAAGGLHYVAKAPRSEREAGCQGLEGKAGHEAVERKEGTAGLNNPRAGAGRTASHVKNFHPTCKSIDIMEVLLRDIPEDALVCDPFLGSGATGLACLRTGHSFLGIEREEEYLEIADARTRHWNHHHRYPATLDSDIDGQDEIQFKPRDQSDDLIFGLFGDDE